MEKYKVGDRVIVRRDLKAGQVYAGVGVVPSMLDFRDATVEIVEICGALSEKYRIKEDQKTWYWSSGMFSGLECIPISIDVSDYL